MFRVSNLQTPGERGSLKDAACKRVSHLKRNLTKGEPTAYFMGSNGKMLIFNNIKKKSGENGEDNKDCSLLLYKNKVAIYLL